MAWLTIKGERFVSVDLPNNSEGDMIFNESDAKSLKAKLKNQGHKVRCVKHSMGGDPYWVVYKAVDPYKYLKGLGFK